MSRAFTRDGQEGEAADVLPDRPLSPHRNLVTRRGLALIDAALAAARAALAAADRAADRSAVGKASRDVRYWLARRGSAELSEPAGSEDEVRFGMAVTLRYADGRLAVWRIVGEDEADAAQGRISHVAPLARALYGKGEGDEIAVGPAPARIVAVDPVPEAA